MADWTWSALFLVLSCALNVWHTHATLAPAEMTFLRALCEQNTSKIGFESCEISESDSCIAPAGSNVYFGGQVQFRCNNTNSSLPQALMELYE